MNFRFGFSFCSIAAMLFGLVFEQPGLAQDSAAVSNTSSSETASETITNSIGMKLVPIPAGRFTMGSPASERGSQEDELLHKVELTQSFHMGATEVTEHQWAMVMEEAFRTEIVEIRDPGTKRLIKKEEKQIKNPKLDSQLPITNISWSQAIEFCRRLGQLPEEKKEGRKYRLPTEAEWEYACRAGTSTAFGFGDVATLIDDYAWYQENCKGLMPVASKKPNAWGLHDMHGNASEWCYDYYDSYPESLTVDPLGPRLPQNLLRVVRGGSVTCRAIQVRSGSREKTPDRGDSSGFRVLLGHDLLFSPTLEEVTNSVGQRLVKIPAGSFLMVPENKNTASEVSISTPFYLAVTEVTQGQWQSVMRTMPWQGKANVVEGANFPATYVSWVDAVDFCKKLSKQEGKNYRLPTEAEWEYVCRAGTDSTFCFGDDVEMLGEYGWHNRIADGTPQMVGRKQPNLWGMYDMHGNVWEWCSDSTKNFSRLNDPIGQEVSRRVLRGGGWHDGEYSCRAAARNGYSPDQRDRELGFRVVLIPPSQ